MCSHQVHMSQPLPLAPQNVNVFGDGALKEKIHLKWPLQGGFTRENVV